MFNRVFKSLFPVDNNIRRPLVVLGSSSSEVFDYIFGDAPDYFPFWAGGWSARGLRREDHKIYLQKILEPISRDANVILNFGCVDVNFNCRNMAATRGEYDFARIMDEAAQGMLTAERNLRKMGFKRIYAVFISPSMSLPQRYWDRNNARKQLPDQMRGRMYYDLFKKVSQGMIAIDVFDELSQAEDGAYLLKDEFMRDKPNHHPDYIKVQGIIWEKMSKIPGLLPRRSELHISEYPHVLAPIKKLMASGTTRPRTCR